jgi:hypothetical protein
MPQRLACAAMLWLALADVAYPQGAPVPVTLDNFIRAETDLYFTRAARESGAFGKILHRRTMVPIDRQSVVRMNRDTLYSGGVFDLEAAPVSITLPDVGKRFMSMQTISQDHFTTEVVYAPGTFTYTRDKVGTRYVYVIIRTLADPEDRQDLAAANAAQDAIKFEQAAIGSFEVPNWDKVSRDNVRSALNALAPLRGGDGAKAVFGAKGEVDPVAHLIGTAIAWGGNPGAAAIYRFRVPKENDGQTVHSLTVRDVPVDGFWSVSVYDAQGFFQANPLNAYSLNNLTAKPDPDGAITVRFGGCEKETPNCLPIMAGWNYTVRLYRPRREVLDGSWTFPEAQPVR